jgi:hypothetical protein
VSILPGTVDMLAFHLRGHIADLDEATADEAKDPTLVLTMDTDVGVLRILVPDSVIQNRRDLLCAARPVEVIGKVRTLSARPMHVATELRLVGRAH